MSLPSCCALCPRACGANRLAGQRGYCGADDRLLVARAALHHWEEPPISGTRGSGTVFFANCPLGCAYCQNKPIASGQVGRAISVRRLAEIFCELQAQGAHNINLVTASHYQCQCIDAIKLAKANGLALPIVYNTSGYESLSAIKQLQGQVDIYLSDFKYASSELALRYSNAADYPKLALAALRAMVEQVGEYCLEKGDLLRRGVIVRHLLLPGQLEDAKQVLRTVFAAVGNAVCYSLMSQYTPPLPATSPLQPATPLPATPPLQPATPAPAPPQSPPSGYPELLQTVTAADYDELVNFALDLGVKHSFMQVGETAKESYIPAFDLTGV